MAILWDAFLTRSLKCFVCVIFCTNGCCCQKSWNRDNIILFSFVCGKAHSNAMKSEWRGFIANSVVNYQQRLPRIRGDDDLVKTGSFQFHCILWNVRWRRQQNDPRPRPPVQMLSPECRAASLRGHFVLCLWHTQTWQPWTINISSLSGRNGRTGRAVKMTAFSGNADKKTLTSLSS